MDLRASRSVCVPQAAAHTRESHVQLRTASVSHVLHLQLQFTLRISCAPISLMHLCSGAICTPMSIRRNMSPQRQQQRRCRLGRGHPAQVRRTGERADVQDAAKELARGVLRHRHDDAEALRLDQVVCARERPRCAAAAARYTASETVE